MKPLRESTEPELQRAAQLVQRAAEAEPWSEAAQARGLARLEAAQDLRAARPGPPRWALALAGPALAALLAWAFWPRPAPGPIAPTAPLAYAPEAGARFNPMSPVGPRLDQGALVVRAPPGQERPVRAGPLQVLVRASARLQVLGEVAEIEVLQGEAEAWIESGPRVRLHQGEHLRSDDARLRSAPAGLRSAPAPTPAPPAPAAVAKADACAGLPEAPARRGCYTQAALGDDLAAQNALYTLGLLERSERGNLGSAVEYWQAYQRRFPQGVLWPEASVNVLTAELERGRYPEALREAEAYLSRDPDSARAAEVRLMRANLLREHLGRARAALEAYRALRSAEVPGAVREEATFGQALAEAELGQPEAAHETLAAYLREYPSGKHAAEAQRRLGQ